MIVKALSDQVVYEKCRPFVIGDIKRLQKAEAILKAGLVIRSIQPPDDADFRFGTVDCLDLDLLPVDLPFGAVSAEAGNAGF